MEIEFHVFSFLLFGSSRPHYQAGPSFSKARLRYLTDKSQPRYLLDSDLSRGQHYPPFEQPGPEVLY